MNKNKTVQPLSENTRKAIIIAAIVVVAVVILSVALALILKPTTLSPDDQDSSSSGSSSLTIRNGDFAYTSSEDTAYPKTAQNWTRYGYRKATGSSHDFESISDSDKAVMGIVNVSDEEDGWSSVSADLAAEGLTVTNPKTHVVGENEENEDDNNNVYMIATKQPTAASILSDSASVSSGASVKITIWLNTQQLTSGEAVVMIQKSTVSAQSKNWYAYDFHVKPDSEQYPADANGWQKLEFYIFNRDASTKYIRVSIGIGNVYSGEEGFELDKAEEPITGEGVLFIDDITYETVTANDYREVVDAEGAEDSTMFKIIENEDIVDESKYLELKAVDGAAGKDIPYFTDAKVFAETEGGYSPFTNRDDFYKREVKDDEDPETGFTIYKLEHDGSEIEKPLALRLDAGRLDDATADNNLDVKSSLLLKDHHHVSFWVRVSQENKAAYANVYVQRKGDNGWEDVNTSSSWTLITTSQEIDKDTNCGWVKYDIYLKPSAIQEEISILFVLGKSDDYTQVDRDNKLFPHGSMYVTTPAYEKISYSDYNSASSGSYVKKIDLVGSSANTTISNGSFSSLNSTGRHPSNWTPAFAGDNAIYKDGKGNDFEELSRLQTTIEGSGTVQGYEKAVTHADGTILDDEQRNVLKIQNNIATSYGYFSSDITLSAKTAYVISAMFRAEDLQGNLKADATPYVYLINADATLERADRIIASATKRQSANVNVQLLGFDYSDSELKQEYGWIRCYMVVVTGDESMSVRLALFNGDLITGEAKDGVVYYDKVEMRTLGTYSFVEADDDEKEENSFYETHYKVEWTKHPYIGSKADVALYGENFNEFLSMKAKVGEETLDKTWLEYWGIESYTVGLDDLDERTLIPEEEEDNTTPGEDEETKEHRDIDLGLLFSVISSVALVAALLVVFVIRIYKNKGRITKTA